MVDKADEIIIVDASEDGTVELVRTHFPSVKVIECPSRASIEALRYRGLKQAKGDVVVLTEQCVLHSPDWLDQIAQAANRGVKVGGGPVAPNATADLSCWALYFARYYRFMPPLADRPLQDFSALNVFYHRSLLERYLENMNGVFPETFFHSLLSQRGCKLIPLPEAEVTNLETASVSRFSVNRFRSGRAFASRRAARIGLLARMLGVVRSPLLPAIFWLRCARAVFSRGRYAVPFLMCSPILVLYFACWALGEMVGFASKQRAENENTDSDLSFSG